MLSSFFKINGLTPIFNDCNQTWEWGCCNGKSPTFCFYLKNYLQVQNNVVEFGVESFGCSHARSTVVACSVPIEYTHLRWISKAPDTIPPATSLIRIFTFDCLSFSVWSFVETFYLLLLNLDHIMAFLLNRMKMFWFLLGKLFYIEWQIIG